MKISQLATELNCQLEGDPERAVLHIASLDDAGPQDLSFLTDSRYTPKVRLTRAGAVILPRDFPAAQLPSGTTALRVADPQVAFARAIALLSPAWRPAPGIHPTASVDPTASIGSDAFLGPYVVIGAHCRLGRNAVVHAHSVLYPNVIVGDDFTAHAHVVVREGVRIGNDVILQPGVVLGGDGYGFARDGERGYVKIPQVGNVVIGDGVEVQANSCIDRSTVAQTVIGPGTKIDNLVHVAHNCKIGARVLLCAQVGLAGSTVVEDDAILAGQVGVAGHCVIGRGAIITAQSGTHGDLAGGKMYSGSPAFEHGQWLRSCSLFPRLTEMYRSIEHLRRKLEEEATKS